MQYTYLGRTGVKVSRLCLGCMSYGDPKWRPWVLDEQAAMPFFRKAVEAGINFFDTADVYSQGVSEEVTAWLLAQPAVTAPIIGATKIEHLEAALAAVDLKLGNEEIQQLEIPYQPHAVRGFG